MTAILVGLGAIAGAVVLAVGDGRPVAPDADPGTAAWLVGLGGLVVAVWLVYERARRRSSEDPVPWSEEGPIVEEPPEAAPQTHPLSGSELAATLERASVSARERRDVEAGMAVVRPFLRETYMEAMVAAGRDAPAVRTSLDDGSWTDDPVAASALSPEVDPPTRSLSRRVRDWLYPAEAVTRRTVRTVDVVTDRADAALPSVVGSDAPRSAPVYEPSLAVQRVGAGGRVRERTGGPLDPDESEEGSR